MKNILLPTDFSENANKALDFALTLANKFKATLHIIHGYEGTTASGQMAIDKALKDDIEQEMIKFLKATKESVPFTINLQGRCRKGYAEEVILDEANEVGAGLIIMGTSGASSLGKKIMGSTTSNVIKSSKIPVLAIPFHVEYADLDNLVVALDAYSIKNPQILSPMVDIAQKLSLNINLVHVANDKIHTEIDPAIKDYLLGASVSFSYNKVHSNEVLTGITDYAKEKGNSLLCMISHQRSWFEDLFHSSATEIISQQATLPLLVLKGGAVV
jgi:nucleotide-binding universal stress UspA family protein